MQQEDAGHDGGHDAGHGAGHPVTDAMLDRNWSELMQELRVVQTGVQLLTGFLVTIPFTQRFAELDAYQRGLYVVLLVGSVLTTGLLVAPVAYHRILFRQRRRPWLVAAANTLARAGLLLLALVCAGVVHFVGDLVLGRGPGLALALAVLAVLVGTWTAAPLLAGRHAR